MNYYTMQIHWNNGKEVVVEERKDYTPGPMNENDWITSIREKIYRTGFTHYLSPGNYEFVSPLRIHTVFLLKQDKKFAP